MSETEWLWRLRPRLADWPASRLKYHVVSHPETGRTSGSVFARRGAFGHDAFNGRCRDGTDRRTELRARCASGDGGRLSDHRPRGIAAATGRPDLRDDNKRAGSAAWVAAGRRLHARGYGIDGRLLDACIRRPRRRL